MSTVVPDTVGHDPDLESRLRDLERCLHAMGQALSGQTAGAVESAAAELHATLSAAVAHFVRNAGKAGMTAPLRQRLALAGAQVAAQREALARATASMDRAIDVLIPRAAPSSLYSASGGAERARMPGTGLTV